MVVSGTALGERTKLSRESLRTMEAVAETNQITFTRNQRSALSMPNGSNSIRAYAWMNDHFSFIGDEQPGKGEIHIDSVEKREVYGEYLLDFGANDMMDKSVAESTFCQVWQHCLPFVKIRKYKVRMIIITNNIPTMLIIRYCVGLLRQVHHLR